MDHTAIALLGYAAWTLALATLIPASRAPAILAGRRKANSFKTDGSDATDFSERLHRAYYNCCENLPAAAAVLLYAIASDQTAVTDPLALILLGARVGQSVTHLISVTHTAVLIRATFYFSQLGLLFWMIFRLIF